MEIETKNASVATMTVTINALHVNGKQMTQSVFKQLPRISWVDIEALPDDQQAWGFVRYAASSSLYQGWLVISAGGVLYKLGLDNTELIKCQKNPEIQQLFIAV